MMIHHAVRGRSTLLGLPRPSTVLRLIRVWDSASCWQIAPRSSQGPNCDLYSWILFFQYCNASHPSMETGGHVLWWIEGIETAFMPSLPKFRCFLAIGASNSSNWGLLIRDLRDRARFPKVQQSLFVPLGVETHTLHTNLGTSWRAHKFTAWIDPCLLQGWTTII